jgi:hypothetical protein
MNGKRRSRMSLAQAMHAGNSVMTLSFETAF